MKWLKYLILLSVFASAQIATGQTFKDSLDLFGGTASSIGFGWYGEAWRDTAWCNDTLKRDTVMVTDTPMVLDTITDTWKPVPRTQKVINSTVCGCSDSYFLSDTGGPTPGSGIINYTYKFRNYYAQIPILWAGWQGKDSETVSPFRNLMVTYKGILPVHQITMNFFYASWGTGKDSTRGAINSKITFGLLSASTTWKTVVIKLPDSLNLTGIAGLTFGIGNAPLGGGGQTSAVGNVKIARVSLLGNIPAISGVNHQGTRQQVNNRYCFTPTTGTISVTALSLKGEVLLSKNVTVQAGKQYSVRQFVRTNIGISASQVRMVKLSAKGVDIISRVW